MVIRQFNIKRIAICKPETDAPLIIDRDRKLPFPIPCQFVKPVAWGYLQIIEAGCQVNVLELAHGPSCNFRRKSPRLSGDVQIPSVTVSEGLDHAYDCNLSRDRCQLCMRNMVCIL